MKKLMFVSQKTHVPLGEGGGETIAFDLLTRVNAGGRMVVRALGAFNYLKVEALSAALAEAKVEFSLSEQVQEVQALSGRRLRYPRFAHVVYAMPGSYTTTLAREDHFGVSLSEYLRQFAPDLLFLQAEGAFEIWNAVRGEKAFHTWFYVQNGYEMGRFAEAKLAPPRLLANSRFVQEKLKRLHGYESAVLYPAVDLERYRVEERRTDGRFTVLMVNPIAVKGLAVLLHLADAFPEVRFLALEGWSAIEGQQRQVLEQRRNVEILPRTWDMASVYARADLLVAPSQWEEAFGRVVVEAHMAGVPTLASRVGGLPEASGDAGLLVDDFRNLQAWTEAFGAIVKDPARLEARRPRLEASARRFGADRAAERFLEIVEAAG